MEKNNNTTPIITVRTGEPVKSVKDVRNELLNLKKRIVKRITKKEEKAWELTRLWYSILSKTSNAFIVMSRKQEDEWERTFTANTMKNYTIQQIDDEIVKARAILANC